MPTLHWIGKIKSPNITKRFRSRPCGGSMCIMNEPKLFLIGDEHDLGKTRQEDK